MVDTTKGQSAGDSHVKAANNVPTFELDKATLATISADAFGKPGKAKDTAVASTEADHFPLKLAQAVQGNDSVGPQGTYGAPAMAGTDVVVRPVTKAVPKDQPYSISNDSDSKKPFVPIPYDIDKQVGGSSFDNYPDFVARVAGTVGGAALSYREYGPTINKPFKYIIPTFDKANGISAHTADEFALKRVPAHNFLKIEASRLQRLTKGFSPDPDLRSDPENYLVDRLMNVKALKERTTDAIREGNNPLQKVDFSTLVDDTRMQKGFNWVTEFDKSQSNLIAERAESVKLWTAEAKTTHLAEVSAAKTGLLKDLGVLAGAQLGDTLIDSVAPRNRISWETSVVDLAAPILMMTSRMTPMGKYAPLVKLGIIIGAHAITHFGFDKQYDESGE